MRASTFGRIAGAFLVTALLTAAGSAGADGEFSVNLSGTSVTVTANAPWHIDQAYVWHVKQKGVTVPNVHFTLTEGSASAQGLPKGTLTIKGAVCNTNGDHKACLPFAKDVTVQ